MSAKLFYRDLQSIELQVLPPGLPVNEDAQQPNGVQPKGGYSDNVLVRYYPPRSTAQ